MRLARITLLCVVALAGCHGDAQVLATAPVDGATGVPIDAMISITFSQAVPPEWSDKAEFLLLLDGQSVPGRATADGPTLTLDPDFPLALGSTYTATLRALAGSEHPHFPTQTWSFTTVGMETNDVLYASTDLTTYELWSVNFDGTRRRNLSGSLDLTSSCAFVRSPDKTGVVFMAVDPQTGRQELYSTPVLGGPLLRISAALPPGQDVYTFLWSPDGSRVAYQIGDSELHTVRPDGTDDVNLTPSPGGGRRVNGFSWSPDSARIAFNADFEQANRFVLRVTSAAAPGNLPLHALPSSDGTGGYGWWSPDGERLAFMHDSLWGPGQDALFVADPDEPLSSARVDQSGAFAAQHVVTAFWIEGSSRLAYWGRVESPLNANLYAVRADGSDHHRVSTATGSGESVLWVSPSPDLTRIGYLATQGSPLTTRLFVYAPAAETLVEVSDPASPWPGVIGFAWLGDSTHLAYAASRVEALTELFAVASDGSARTALLEGVFAQNFSPAPSGLVAFAADVDGDAQDELYSIRLDGTEMRLLSSPSPPRQITDFIWSSDGKVVLYRPARVEEEDTYYELHSAVPSGSASRRISHDLGVTSRIEAYEPR